MKRALIDSNNSRVIQIVNIGEEFEVHNKLYWVDCPDNADTYYLYDPVELTFEDPHAASKDEFGNPVEPFNMQRMRAYPPAGDQMDMLWKEIRKTGSISVNGDWFKSIQAVKNGIPKPSNYDPANPIATTTTKWVDANGIMVKLFSNVNGTGGTGTDAKFKIRKSVDAYQVIATTGGTGYTVGNSIQLTGSDYSCTISVAEVDNTGSIVTVNVV